MRSRPRTKRWRSSQKPGSGVEDQLNVKMSVKSEEEVQETVKDTKVKTE